MLKRLVAYIILTVFIYDCTCSVFARTIRTRKNYNNNNSNMTNSAKGDLQTKINNFYNRDLNAIYEDVEKDYLTALKKYLDGNPSESPEQMFQNAYNNFFASNREFKLTGVKNPIQALEAMMPPQVLKMMKQYKMDTAQIIKNMNASVDMQGLMQLKDDAKKQIRKKRSRKTAKLESIMNHLIKEAAKVNKHTYLAANTFYTNPQGEVVATDAPGGSGNVNSYSGNYVTSDNYNSNAEDDAYDDQFLNPALETDAETDALASQEKGYNTNDNEQKAKKNEGTMLTMLGIALIVAGGLMIKAGIAANKADVVSHSAGNPQITTGIILIAGGVLVLMMGMQKNDEAAALKDQGDAQKKKNEDIARAKAEKKMKEKMQKMNEWKKEIYRKRQNEQNEIRQNNLNRQLQNAAQQAR